MVFTMYLRRIYGQGPQCKGAQLGTYKGSYSQWVFAPCPPCRHTYSSWFERLPLDRCSHRRSNSFFTSDSTHTDEVNATKNSISGIKCTQYSFIKFLVSLIKKNYRLCFEDFLYRNVIRDDKKKDVMII